MKPVVVVVVALVALLDGGLAAVLEEQAGRGQVRIAGGGLRQNGDLKFIVDVIETTAGFAATHHGSAVLLHPNWVLSTKEALTAGCLKGIHLEVGKSKGGAGQKVDIDKQVHSADGVLTLAKLKTAVQYDAISRPVNLPYPDVNNTDVDALLVGWTSDDKELRAAPIHILSMDDCKQMLKLNATMDAPLCTADSKAATCEADDGSPLVQDLKNGIYKLLGVAIETKGLKCPPTANAVRKYADVAKYAQWIVNTVFAS